MGLVRNSFPAQLIVCDYFLHSLILASVTDAHRGTFTPAGIGNTQVSNNSIQAYCELLNDCGGIYTLGEQGGTQLSGNVINGSKSMLAPWVSANINVY